MKRRLVHLTQGELWVLRSNTQIQLDNGDEPRVRSARGAVAALDAAWQIDGEEAAHFVEKLYGDWSEAACQCVGGDRRGGGHGKGCVVQRNKGRYRYLLMLAAALRGKRRSK